MTTISIQGLTINISNSWVISGDEVLSDLVKLYIKNITITNMYDTMIRLISNISIDFPKMEYVVNVAKDKDTFLSEGITIY